MALPQPDFIDNRGDVARIGHVLTLYIRILAADLRALAAWTAWKDRHTLPMLKEVLRRRALTPDEDATMVRVFTEVDPEDLATFQRAVDAMGVARPWVALLLLRFFQAATWTKLGLPPRPPHLYQDFTVGFQPDLVGHLEPGRKPRYGGQNYERYVHWHYRRDIKHPRDPVHELEAEYARIWQRHTPAHGTVIEAIDHVTALLDLVSLSPDGRTVLVLTKKPK